jgi:hypothetical protein
VGATSAVDLWVRVGSVEVASELLAQRPDQGNDTSKLAPPAASMAQGPSDAELVRMTAPLWGSSLAPAPVRPPRPGQGVGACQ